MDPANFDKLMKELDDLTEEDLDEDFYGTVLDQDRWDLYRRICTDLKSAMAEESKIEEVKCQDTPYPKLNDATITVKMPFLWGTFDKRVKDAIGRATLECDGIAIICLNDKKIQITFSIGNIWKEFRE